MERFESLLTAYPGRWPKTEAQGNSLSIVGMDIVDDRAGGVVNSYEEAITDADLIDELDCQETSGE